MLLKRKFILLIILTFLGCKVQKVVNIENPDGWVENTYAKDINNHYSDVVGVWKWVDGNSSLELVFFKITKFAYPTSNLYRDVLLGHYKYIENGVEVANTLDSQKKTPLDFDIALSFDTPTKYYMTIGDVISGKGKVGSFIINTDGTASINLIDTQGIKVNPNNIPFSLPTNLMLNKIY